MYASLECRSFECGNKIQSSKLSVTTWIFPKNFRGGKVRLIKLLDYLSVASPESGLFSDWSRNKRYLKLKETVECCKLNAYFARV